MRTVLQASVGELRDRVDSAGLEAAYYGGRALPFRAIASLALSLARAAPQSPPSTANAAEPLPVTAQRRSGALSERQRRVLRLVAQGLSDKAIASRLSVSTNTVRDHLAAVFDTLGVGTRAQAVALAARQDLL